MSYQHRRDGKLDFPTDQLNLQMGLSWQLFTGRRNAYEVEKSLLSQEAALLDLKDTRLSKTIELSNSISNLKQLKSQYIIQKKLIESGKKVVDKSQSLYQKGLMGWFQLESDRAAYREYQQNYYSLVHNILESLTDLSYQVSDHQQLYRLL